MASPPHIPQINIPNPRKRSSISSITSATAAKKRKPSNLRNAFSPESEGVGSPRFSRSPSVDSVATGSIANGAGGRKRKRKDGDAQSVAGSVAGSLRGGAARSAVNGAEGEGADGADEDGEEEVDDDPEDEMAAVLEGMNNTAASRQQEKENERLLMEAMDDDQKTRYEQYRRIKLKKETVRRLVNQTLSQSVPQPVITAVLSYSKAFIGELIDRALTVRDEWAAARTHVPNSDLPLDLLKIGLHTPKGHRKDAKTTNLDIQNAGLILNQPGIRERPYWKEIDKNATLEERLKTIEKGPLTPDHMREALRRYKRDRDGGGAAFAGMSLEGVEKTMARTGGRRLFR